jgi:hypothetical protein
MPELKLFFELLGANLGSVLTLLLSIFLAMFYFFQVGTRVAAMERKMGLRPSVNGSNLAVVVTKGDLIAFEKSLLDTLRKDFVASDICILKHAGSLDAMKNMQQEIHDVRHRQDAQR